MSEMHTTRAFADAVEALERQLLPQGLHLALAESCTAGLVAATIAERPGVSRWLAGSAVVYTAQSKERLLGVPASTIAAVGLVSEPVALAMAAGALRLFAADRAGAVTGVAGPGADERGVAAGTVWIARADRNGSLRTRRLQLEGDRDAVRRGAALALLCLLAE